MIEIGARAPAFEVTDQHGDEVTLESLAGAPAVVYFYPKDNTPGCTVEAIDFTALKGAFEALGYRIYGASPDSAASHCRFIDKQSLGIDLLSDPDKGMLEAWGAWGEKKNYGRVYQGVIRSTVVIDADGVVTHHFRNVRAKGHAARVLEAVKG